MNVELYRTYFANKKKSHVLASAKTEWQRLESIAAKIGRDRSVAIAAGNYDPDDYPIEHIAARAASTAHSHYSNLKIGHYYYKV